MDPEGPLTHAIVRELHRISVDNLTREGDPNPGKYRGVDVEISKADHLPPSHLQVHAEMSDWLDFANRSLPTSQHMLHVAIAHHRFLWIHPFRNGNGRVSRLLSYAMLRRHGFVSPIGLRAVNPTAVFGNDRDGYYAALAAADNLTNQGTVEWCTFFVRGIHTDLERLSKLQDFDFVQNSLVGPAIDRLVASGGASLSEAYALRIAMQKILVRAGDLQPAFPGTASQRSIAIRGLLEKNLLAQERPGGRTYHLNLLGGRLGPLLVRQLDDLGYLPHILKDDAG
nr:Fic family protein [Leucobacter weissii]